MRVREYKNVIRNSGKLYTNMAKDALTIMFLFETFIKVHFDEWISHEPVIPVGKCWV